MIYTYNMILKMAWLVALGVLAPLSASATVIFSDTFEVYSVGDVTCATLQSTTGYSNCREDPDRTINPSDISIVSSVPGSNASLPSGSHAMRVYTNGMTEQSDAGLQLPGAAAMPADSWWQVAMYVNNFGDEVTIAGSRPMKLFYPCNADYPCNTNYFLIYTSVETSYNPFNSSALSVPSNGDMWIESRNMEGTVNWAGADPGDENKLGQTNLSERIRPNRWNIIRCHANFTNTSSGQLDCWIGPKGSALTHVLSWHGGTSVEGYSFTWTVPQARGHQSLFWPSTVPANNANGTVLYMYFDDFYLATSENDLPVYGGSVSSTVSGDTRFTGSVRIQ
jgi:hypothetical protein